MSASSAFSTFSADWLRLREPVDRVARAAAAAALGEDWQALPRRSDGSGPRPGGALSVLQVVDLGCGTGAALRDLAPRLGGPQRWRVFDHDEALLKAWPQALSEWAQPEGHRVDVRGDELRIEGRGFEARVERQAVDLARELDRVPLGDADLVCASALLDLVSREWLARLLERTRITGACLSFALVVDGRLEWDPALPGDDEVALAFARHQGRDKGFGPALGADAPATAMDLLQAAGYAVKQAHSDWQLRGGPLLAALIEGMARAAAEQAPDAAPAFAAWQQRRTAALERTGLRVGHVDLFARPLRRT